MQGHVALVECVNTCGQELGMMLSEQLKNYELTNKVIECVKEDGATLKPCTNALQLVSSFGVADVKGCSSPTYFANIVSGACNAALSKRVCEGPPLISLTRLEVLSHGQRSLQKVRMHGMRPVRKNGCHNE